MFFLNFIFKNNHPSLVFNLVFEITSSSMYNLKSFCNLSNTDSAVIVGSVNSNRSNIPLICESHCVRTKQHSFLLCDDCDRVEQVSFEGKDAGDNFRTGPVNFLFGVRICEVRVFLDMHGAPPKLSADLADFIF